MRLTGGRDTTEQRDFSSSSFFYTEAASRTKARALHRAGLVSEALTLDHASLRRHALNQVSSRLQTRGRRTLDKASHLARTCIGDAQGYPTRQDKIAERRPTPRD